MLVKEGIICICAGGGGIPVAMEQEEGATQWRRHGVEAVIDKVTPTKFLAGNKESASTPVVVSIKSLTDKNQ